MHGSGWHLPERDGDAWFCWMGPETTSWLDLRVNGQGERVLRCHILHALEPRALETSKARVNDRPVPLTWGSHGRFVAVEGKVAGEALEAEQGRARVSFQIADVVRPCDLTPGSTDTRELGLAISWLGLRPAGRAA